MDAWALTPEPPRGSQEQERMLQESRKSGTRSVAIALAEIQIIASNVYVERAPRQLREVRSLRCGGKGGAPLVLSHSLLYDTD